MHYIAGKISAATEMAIHKAAECNEVVIVLGNSVSFPIRPRPEPPIEMPETVDIKSLVFGKQLTARAQRRKKQRNESKRK